MPARTPLIPLLVLLTMGAFACAPADQTAEADTAAESMPEAAGADAPLFDSDAVATSLVTASANVREGDVVLISGNPRDQQLLEDLAVQVRRQGGFPMVELATDRMTRRMVVDVPEQYDTQAPTLGLKLAEVFDVIIVLESAEDPTLLADVSPERLAARAQAGAPVQEAMMRRNVRVLNLGNGMYPSAAAADAFGMPQPDLARLFWNAVNTDPALLDAAGQRVKQVLESGTELRITATNGTDVTVQVGNRPVLISDGAISPAEEERGGAATTVWLPAGEVFLTPVPGTASGTVVFDAFEFQGTPVEGLTLTFENGRLTSMNATAGLAPVQAAYDAASAGKDEFAVIDIGLNPNVTVTADSRFRSWVAAGIVSVGIGDNVWAGGSNSTPYGLFGHIAGATVTVDGNAVVENGRLAN